MPGEHDPVLVAGFTVSRRGGRFAPMAINYLTDLWGAKEAGQIAPEEFLDFSVNRPYVRQADGNTVIDWPETQFFLAPADDTSREVLFVAGSEPNFRWQAYAEHVLSRATEANIRCLVNIRGYAAAVPHSRPAPVFITCADASLASQFACPNAAFKNDGLGDVGHALASLAGSRGWSLVDIHVLLPEYIRPMPRGQAFLALTKLLDGFVHRSSDTTALESAIQQERRTVDENVRVNLELLDQIRDLEAKHDGGNDWAAEATGTDSDDPAGELPPGGEVADQIEKFFRERDR